jgi:hypothetical protein
VQVTHRRFEFRVPSPLHHQVDRNTIVRCPTDEGMTQTVERTAIDPSCCPGLVKLLANTSGPY